MRALKNLSGLKDWNGIADADSPEVSLLQQSRRAPIDLLLEPFLGKDTNLYQWRSTTFLQRILTDRRAKWLPVSYKTYDEFLAAAADLAASKLAEQSKSERVEDWAWKRFNSLDMFHPIGHEGLLKRFLSITDKPQAGTQYSVRAASKTHGPAMRFVGNPGNWDESILLIPAGNPASPAAAITRISFRIGMKASRFSRRSAMLPRRKRGK